MDPLSQAVLGASASQSATRDETTIRWVFLIGCIAGMAPDLDILIRSKTDPLLFLEYHRQFTHSLIFIPFGSFIVATALYVLTFKSRPLSFGLMYLYSTLGYATHGLLDTCTSYGTQLLWPFSDQRFAWNNVAIIDPLFTLPILFLLIISFYRKKRSYARYALFYALFYLSLGLVLHQRAESMLLDMVQARGHEPVRYTVKPTFGNLLIWKFVYEHEDRYYVDAARIFGTPAIIEGESIKKLHRERDLPWLQADSVQSRDVERFRWFSSDYLALHPQQPEQVIDVRYSLLPNSVNPMWGITLDPANQQQHVSFTHNRRARMENRKAFWKMLLNKSEDPNQ